MIPNRRSSLLYDTDLCCDGSSCAEPRAACAIPGTTLLITIVIVLLAHLPAGLVQAQNRTPIHRYRFFDTTRAEDYQRIKRRRLTTDVDSTGIAMYAWGDECYFKINLLERMLISADFYETGDRDGHPYVMYGNDNFRFRMYINRSGNFEFDAIIRRKSPRGRHTIPFNIQAQGLEFWYQPELTETEVNEGCIRPDSVVGSYAVYHATKTAAGVCHRDDGTIEHYGTGKAFHLYRPRAWDNSGDTVWGTILIDTDRGRMEIGVDSTWMANAIYPVTIDPHFGDDSDGGSGVAMSNSLLIVNATMGATAGVSDSVVVYAVTAGSSGYLGSGLYDDDGYANNLLSTSAAEIAWSTSSTQWYKIAHSGQSLSASTEYWIGVFVNGYNCYPQYDLWIPGEYDIGPDTWADPNDPITWDPASTGRIYSVYCVYTESGGGVSARRRRLQWEASK